MDSRLFCALGCATGAIIMLCGAQWLCRLVHADFTWALVAAFIIAAVRDGWRMGAPSDVDRDHG